MAARASVKADWFYRSVNVYISRPLEPSGYSYLAVQAERKVVTDESSEPVDSPLRLHEDEARALYEALAEHFGHTGNDVRALRKDYDAERGRVDVLISHLVESK